MVGNKHATRPLSVGQKRALHAAGERGSTRSVTALPFSTRNLPSRSSLRQRDSRNGCTSSAAATSFTCTPGVRLSFTAVPLKDTL